MAILTWRARRQLLYFGIFGAVVFGIVFGIIAFFSPSPTCFDHKLNQGEEGIDCGGPCALCLGDVRDVSVLWTRFLEVGPARYDVAILVDNPNLFAGAPIVNYRVKLHDKDNVLIALRGGMTFMNPHERFIILEANIPVLNRTPAQATIEFDQIAWERIEEEKLDMTAYNYRFSNEPKGRLDATVRNNNFFEERNIEIMTALFDDSGNAFAVSKTRIDRIEAETERAIGFSWPDQFQKEPGTILIFVRRIPKLFLESEI